METHRLLDRRHRLGASVRLSHAGAVEAGVVRMNASRLAANRSVSGRLDAVGQAAGLVHGSGL